MLFATKVARATSSFAPWIKPTRANPKSSPRGWTPPPSPPLPERPRPSDTWAGRARSKPAATDPVQHAERLGWRREGDVESAAAAWAAGRGSVAGSTTGRKSNSRPWVSAGRHRARHNRVGRARCWFCLRDRLRHARIPDGSRAVRHSIPVWNHGGHARSGPTPVADPGCEIGEAARRRRFFMISAGVR